VNESDRAAWESEYGVTIKQPLEDNSLTVAGTPLIHINIIFFLLPIFSDCRRSKAILLSSSMGDTCGRILSGN
jgi:hypothetical protein